MIKQNKIIANNTEKLKGGNKMITKTNSNLVMTIQGNRSLSIRRWAMMDLVDLTDGNINKARLVFAKAKLISKYQQTGTRRYSIEGFIVSITIIDGFRIINEIKKENVKWN